MARRPGGVAGNIWLRLSGTYDGQIVVDMGGNQLMLHSGPVHTITVELGRGSGKPTARGLPGSSVPMIALTK